MYKFKRFCNTKMIDDIIQDEEQDVVTSLVPRTNR